ncbi:MAG TPA: SRPBCC family protein [Candidatus Sulfopaludibacter sp.]|nr:SRPBCC family protein [Candidatus Sulfopaludibacter sp.]
MNEMRIAVDIQAPPDRVWEVIRDAERWPEWTASVDSVRLLRGGPLEVGRRALVRQPKLPPAVWRVTELDDGARFFTWVNRGPGMLLTASHGVEPDGAGSRATLSLRFSGLLGPLLFRLTRALSERYIAMEAQGLKARSEGALPTSRKRTSGSLR